MTFPVPLVILELYFVNFIKSVDDVLNFSYYVTRN